MTNTMTYSRFFACFLVGVMVFMLVLYFDIMDWGYLQSRIPAMIIPPAPNSDTRVPPRNAPPGVAIAPRVWTKFPGETWKNIQLPLLTSHPAGGLGNLMGEYATLYALKRFYGASVRLSPALGSKLLRTFPKLTLEPLPGKINASEWTVIQQYKDLNFGTFEAAASGLLGPKLFLCIGVPFEIQLFNKFRPEILREFTFNDDVQSKVKKFWETELKSFKVVVGVHVRRTDYVNHIKRFGGRLPEYSYFKRATDYYRKKYPGVHFLVASDDRGYINKTFANFTDVSFTPGSSRDLDLALMASCNHSIITVGSFGFWCGYLCGGEVVYSDVRAVDFYTFQRTFYEFSQLDFFTPLPP